MNSITVVEQDSLYRRAAHALGIGTWERDDYGRLRRGSWMQTWSGEKAWPLDPRVEEVHYDDVCVGLARAARYRGQTREFLSVAEHSVIVSLYVEKLARERMFIYREEDIRDAARYALLHDAAEAYIGDVARPLKRQRVMRGFCQIEKKWERAIIGHFMPGFDPKTFPGLETLVKEVDNRVVLDEIDALMIDPDMWPRSARYLDLKPLGAEIAGLEWRQATTAFSQRFAELWPNYPES